jgi:hypothetical protein
VQPAFHPAGAVHHHVDPTHHTTPQCEHTLVRGLSVEALAAHVLLR